MEARPVKRWGWGWEDKTIPLGSRPVLLRFLQDRLKVSHHDGIGADHAPYLHRLIGEDGIVVLRALKKELDPEGIMNPEKLMAGSA